ncbi:MAG: hypothetical protein ACWGOX_16535 [Desulforhopalus sp.]
MAKKKQLDRERFGRCDICNEPIPIEFYFNKGDEVTCYECGSEYIIISRAPVKLSLLEGSYDPDEIYSDLRFDD